MKPNGWTVVAVAILCVAAWLGMGWYNTAQTVEYLKFEAEVAAANVATGLGGDKEEVIVTHKDFGTRVSVAGRPMSPEERNNDYKVYHEGDVLVVTHVDRQTNRQEVVMRRGGKCENARLTASSS